MAKINKKFHGFTLIELLIVVAIIAVLAAIAVPNFLEAQSRAKVSRARADMRSIASACEAYHTDNNAYPAGYKTALRYGLPSLTTPVAFISSANILDPFAAPGLALSKRLLDYEIVNPSGKIIEAGGGTYSIDPASPGEENPKGVAWWLSSRGPDKSFGFQPSNPEYDLRKKFYESDTDPEPFLNTIYDPTNGTNSLGNIYRSGGSPANRALKLMN